MRRVLVPPATLRLAAAGVLVAVTLPAAVAAREEAVKPVVVPVTVVNGRPVGGIKRQTVKRGDTVRIVVRTNAGTKVHVHGYNLEKNVKIGLPTTIQFVARVSGRFAVELHPMDALVAQITVRS